MVGKQSTRSTSNFWVPIFALHHLNISGSPWLPQGCCPNLREWWCKATRKQHETTPWKFLFLLVLWPIHNIPTGYWMKKPEVLGCFMMFWLGPFLCSHDITEVRTTPTAGTCCLTIGGLSAGGYCSLTGQPTKYVIYNGANLQTHETVKHWIFWTVAAEVNQ